MKHTRGPWVADTKYKMVNHGPHDYGVALVVDSKIDAEEGTANTVLIALAPTAPHECDPDCPGEQNRRKLVAYERLVAVEGLEEEG